MIGDSKQAAKSGTYGGLVLIGPRCDGFNAFSWDPDFKMTVPSMQNVVTGERTGFKFMFVSPNYPGG